MAALTDPGAAPGPLVTGALAAWLEANRSELNARIAEARRSSPAFEPAVLADALRQLVAPLVDAVEARGEGFATSVAAAGFDLALDLCAQGRLTGAVRDGWADLLPALVPQLAADPHRVIASVTNALANLERTPGGRPDTWIAVVRAVAPASPTPDSLLAAGQVAGWRCGLAAYRTSALALAETLDPAVAAEVLGHDLAALTADPWLGDRPRPAPASPVRAGGYRGFGGPFGVPPIVGLDGERLVAIDGDEAWFVFADGFGATVVRAPATAALGAAAGGAVPAAVAAWPEVTSWVDTPVGLVATTALTHDVLFLGPA